MWRPSVIFLKNRHTSSTWSAFTARYLAERCVKNPEIRFYTRFFLRGIHWNLVLLRSFMQPSSLNEKQRDWLHVSHVSGCDPTPALHAWPRSNISEQYGMLHGDSKHAPAHQFAQSSSSYCSQRDISNLFRLKAPWPVASPLLLQTCWPIIRSCYNRRAVGWRLRVCFECFGCGWRSVCA